MFRRHLDAVHQDERRSAAVKRLKALALAAYRIECTHSYVSVLRQQLMQGKHCVCIEMSCHQSFACTVGALADEHPLSRRYAIGFRPVSVKFMASLSLVAQETYRGRITQHGHLLLSTADKRNFISITKYDLMLCLSCIII